MAIANILLLFAASFILPFSSCDEAFFAEIPPELRCSGCELTVKVLHYMLVHKHGNLQSHVDKALDKACDKKRFDISEFNPERMVKVCNFMTEKHGKELRYELLDHYQHAKRPTYLEFVQHICLDVLKMCAGVSHKQTHHDKEGDTVIHFDSKSHGFTVVPGKNLKLPNPVHEMHDEL